MLHKIFSFVGLVIYFGNLGLSGRTITINHLLSLYVKIQHVPNRKNRINVSYVKN